MKTLFQQAPRFVLFAALASVGFTPLAHAQSEPEAAATTNTAQPVYIDKVGNFVYLVRVSNPAQQLSKVQLVRQHDGAKLFEATSRKPSFGHKINVQKLPDGEYTFVVKTGSEVHQFVLDLRTTTERSAQLNAPAVVAMH
ncbi:hypothetical protein [Hymenobacter sp. CRA2]|uniref:hypothetical protein n=1 Tax=Hymenobacter sp. CRA2 TaxID=1955620 RepID=UPI00098EFDCF|nr:hypothetical protein [Hymenobacter sp. CRA2]OON71104.1 hypothetical protein B0919_03700 [Hymenobacter sp. CRA2]